MKRMRAFTVIELLIVTAMLTILAAILLPALRAAVYRAKMVSCMSGMKQIGAGLHNYATSHSRWYPKNGASRTRLTSMSANHYGNGYGYDIRPLLKPYYTEDLAVFSCPAVPVKRTDHYNLFFDNLAGAKRGYTKIGYKPGDTGDGGNSVQRGVNGNILSDGGGPFDEVAAYGSTMASCFASWYHRPTKGLMRKIGQRWRCRDTGRFFSLLASDRATHYGGHPGYRRYSNHHEFEEDYALDTSAGYYASPAGMKIYPAMSMNCLSEDQSAGFFRVEPGYGTAWKENFQMIGNEPVPLDYQH